MTPPPASDSDRLGDGPQDVRSSGPRLFGIVASRAPVVAIIRRGPSEWAHLGKLTLDPTTYQSGSWFHGRIFPQKCDLSPDGRWFAYSAHKHGTDWAAGEIYEAVSRLPWLHALAAWEAGTTYTRGMHFVEEPRRNDMGEPDVGDIRPLTRTLGLVVTRPVQFAVERRRGWAEVEGTPPWSERDFFDENRHVAMERSSPADPSVRLRVSGTYAAFRGLPSWRTPAVYELESDHDIAPLEGAQWADWAPDGRLVVASDTGLLSVHGGVDPRRLDPGDPLFEVDLAPLGPAPEAPPDEARRW